MPIYEFSCEVCGTRFERLVDAGTDAAECPECGAERAPRVLSSQSTPMRLVRSSGERRKQERRNAAMRKAAKARFSRMRRATRQPSRGGGSA